MRVAWLSILALVASVAGASIVEAQTSCFVGQIRFFVGQTIPSRHMPADGRLLPVPTGDPSQWSTEQFRNAAIFSLIDNTYGGSATTFALPDLRGRTPLGVGTRTSPIGPSGTPRTLGDAGGAETVTLGVPELPSHSHVALGTDEAAIAVSPQDTVWAGKSRTRLYGPPTALAPMSPTALEPTGGSAPVENMTPFMALNPAMCTEGLFPQRPPQ